MKTITLKISDSAYRKINALLKIERSNSATELLNLALAKIIRHMDENKPVVTLQTPEDKTTDKF